MLHDLFGLITNDANTCSAEIVQVLSVFFAGVPSCSYVCWNVVWSLNEFLFSLDVLPWYCVNPNSIRGARCFGFMTSFLVSLRPSPMDCLGK